MHATDRLDKFILRDDLEEVLVDLRHKQGGFVPKGKFGNYNNPRSIRIWNSHYQRILILEERTGSGHGLWDHKRVWIVVSQEKVPKCTLEKCTMYTEIGAPSAQVDVSCKQ